MLDRVKLDLTFDVQRLQEDLQRLQTGEWIEHFVKENFEGDWSAIPLRGPEDATHPVMMIYPHPNCSGFADTPFLENTPYFRTVLESFNCPLQTARLMKLSAGSRIKEHNDHDMAAEDGSARLHIPIVTNDQVDFRLNGTRVMLQEGECWYLRLADPHSVVNDGPSDRVHLVIDVLVNDWLQDLLDA